METSSDYINHVNIVKELNLYTTIRENQKPYEKRFEEIYQKVKESDVNLSSAKDFLQDLSESELGVLQKFEGLADPIKIESLTNEGAYNLLVHTYEKYDWNNDGITQIGAARVLMNIPKNMDDDTKKAWVKTLNAMGNDFMATSVITLSLNDEYNKRQIAEHFAQMSDEERSRMQESASYDINQFIKETLSKPYTPKLITFLDILEKVDGILSGSNGGYASPELIASTQRLKEELTKAYAEVQNENKERLTTQQEIEIKQQAAQTISETEESPLATAIQESSQMQDVKQLQATEKLAEMKEKYKDIYTPIPETYSVKDEELQARKIYEAYPKYISGPDFLQIVSSFLEGTRIELGQKLTPAQEEAQKLDYAQALQKAYDIFGGEEEFIAMQKGVQAIKDQYPINEWAKQGYADNSRELARFKNAAIYEGLERGLSLESATKVARNAEYMFMDVSYGAKMLDDMLIKAGLMSPAPEGGRETVQTEVNFDHPNNGTMDLRAYGIDGAWNANEVIENQKGMLQEIEKKISQFNFMLNNKELIKEAIMKLPADARGAMNNEGYESWINKELLPRMQLGYEVFSKYQIYDN